MQKPMLDAETKRTIKNIAIGAGCGLTAALLLKVGYEYGLHVSALVTDQLEKANWIDIRNPEGRIFDGSVKEEVNEWYNQIVNSGIKFKI